MPDVSPARSDAREVHVRAAGAADAARLAELSGQLGYPTTTADILRRLMSLLTDQAHGVFLAEAANEVIGWLHVQERRVLEHDFVAEVTALVVDERSRSRGVGQVLMGRAEEWARLRGLGAVVLRSNVIRERAHVFYERLGYEVIKKQKVFRKAL